MHVENLRCEYKDNPVGIGVLSPRISWAMVSGGRNVMQVSYQLQVSDGSNFFEPLWDTGKVDSDRSVHVAYEGPPPRSRRRYYYRVRVWDNHVQVSDWSKTAFWETGFLDDHEWLADFITPAAETDPAASGPCPFLRKEFTVSGRVASARAYATALGMYELRLNGRRVGDELLTPGWTSYNKRLQYQAYDVMYLLRQGDNAAGALLGDGWYRGNLVWKDQRCHYGDKTGFLLQLHISYDDGREQVVVSDGSWKSSTGPILMSEIYHGETYDARLEMPGWETAGFDDAGWETVRTYSVPKSVLTAQENVPVKRIEELKPTGVFRTPAGETVLDMGQNMVGWVRFRVKGSRGSRIILRHAEVLDKDGNFYTANLRTARQRIEYTLNGEGEECFEPHFTFQGFRYVMIEEHPGVPAADDFTGIVIHSAMEQIGSFECSDALLNQLQHNILWGLKGNFVDVPTDCPQRDERLGWTGDAQVFIRTACFNMNVGPFFTKWLRDLRADQLGHGGVPHVIPDVLRAENYSSSGWADAAVICPWTIYLSYGDERILAEQYGSMKAWVEYVRARAENGLIWKSGFHFGDWVALDAKEGSYFGATPSDLIATAYYAYSTELLAKTAAILGHDEDAECYRALHHDIVTAFRREFYTPSGRLAAPTQTAHVLALIFGLTDSVHRQRTIDTLAQYITENKDHLTTGFLGASYLCHVLSANGCLDLAYRLLTQIDYPSWLYQVTKGATTIWEHWDGIKPDGSFWSPDMNSFNHYAYGAIGEWLYRVVAGIEIDERKPGYKHILFKPRPGGGLTFVRAGLQSMYGPIGSEWKVEGDHTRLRVTIPPNTSAIVVLPCTEPEKVLVDGKPLRELETPADCAGITDGVPVSLGSGEYEFVF